MENIREWNRVNWNRFQFELQQCKTFQLSWSSLEWSRKTNLTIASDPMNATLLSAPLPHFYCIPFLFVPATMHKHIDLHLNQRKWHRNLNRISINAVKVGNFLHMNEYILPENKTPRVMPPLQHIKSWLQNQLHSTYRWHIPANQCPTTVSLRTKWDLSG